MKSTVQLYAGDNEILIPTANEWHRMEKVLSLLQPFFEITKKVSCEQSILSAVIPDVADLDRYLAKYNTKDTRVHNLKEELRQELQRRCFSRNEHELDVTTSKPYIVSALLDPKFKGKFMSVKSLSDGRVMLLEDMRGAASLPESAEEQGYDKDSAEEDDCEPWQKKRKPGTLQEEIHNGFAACYDEISDDHDHAYGPDDQEGYGDLELEAIVRKKKQKIGVPFSVLAAELEGYINMSCIPRNESPFFRWKQHKTTFPHIAKLAQQHLRQHQAFIQSAYFLRLETSSRRRDRGCFQGMARSCFFPHHTLGRF